MASWAEIRAQAVLLREWSKPFLRGKPTARNILGAIDLFYDYRRGVRRHGHPLLHGADSILIRKSNSIWTSADVPPLWKPVCEGHEYAHLWLGTDCGGGEVTLEAFSALQVPTGYAIGRPRPYVYGDRAPLKDRTSPDAGRSFFSGHVANTTAVTVAAACTFERLHHPALAWTTLVLGMVGSAFVGVTRVVSGNHFPTDILAGAAVGAGAGVALPALHSAQLQLAPAATDGASGFRVSCSFLSRPCRRRRFTSRTAAATFPGSLRPGWRCPSDR